MLRISTSRDERRAVRCFEDREDLTYFSLPRTKSYRENCLPANFGVGSVRAGALPSDGLFRGDDFVDVNSKRELPLFPGSW